MDHKNNRQKSFFPYLSVDAGKSPPGSAAGTLLAMMMLEKCPSLSGPDSLSHKTITSADLILLFYSYSHPDIIPHSTLAQSDAE